MSQPSPCRVRAFNALWSNKVKKAASGSARRRLGLTTIARHTHPGEEAVYVLDGATLQMPDGKEIARPSGQAGVNVRDVPHAGYKVVGDKPLKILTVHIVDKGKPMTVPAP